MAPKRAASTSFPTGKPFAENGGTAAGPSTKRTRFVSPNNAEFIGNETTERANMAQFEEQVDASLEDGLTTSSRRNRVNVDGYDSDSTDDGEGVVESRKKGNKEDEDLDMFATGDDNADKEDEDTFVKKKTEYLKLGDIEGQEFDDEKSLSDEEEEPEDEDDAERRKKAGMGYELSSFNMREEMEEGKFDADGTFVRTHDPHGIHDRWMEGLSEKEIIKARKNKKQREKEERERVAKEEKETMSKEEAERELVGYLKKSETTLEALQRLGTVAKKRKSSQNHSLKRKNNTGMDVDQALQTSPSLENKIQDAIGRITSLSSILMSHGNIDIYSWTYEQLLRSVRAAGNVEPDWVPPNHSAIYEYRWAVNDSGETNQNGESHDHVPPQVQVYGPYREEELLSWYNANYFGDGGEKIRLRRTGENEWWSWDEVIF
ncbi:hypothetical protein Clacol_004812 [Clathrus columnatus]|uniref:GYF domain-containing protein n=1 Tax=Clathrus columnatus TaxID=1419009 RepID=A0AAV5AF55_9AGAM|nr:hypothetical protein Clacol_004812 [Clathrus columnatus]